MSKFAPLNPGQQIPHMLVQMPLMHAVFISMRRSQAPLASSDTVGDSLSIMYQSEGEGGGGFSSCVLSEGVLSVHIRGVTLPDLD